MFHLMCLALSLLSSGILKHIVPVFVPDEDGMLGPQEFDLQRFPQRHGIVSIHGMADARIVKMSVREVMASVFSTQHIVAQSLTAAADAMQSVPTSPNQSLHKVFISYSRRQAGPLNASVAIVDLLRAKKKSDGSPYSRSCYAGDAFASPTAELWLDKEQMKDKGGRDWNEMLVDAQSHSVVNVIFLSHAYCGSRECTKEFHYGDMKRFTMIPVFLEFGGISEKDFPHQVERLRCDHDRETYGGWETAKMAIEKVAFGLQGVPAKLNMEDFECKDCEHTRDHICSTCHADAVQNPSPQLCEVAATLGQYIDSYAEPTVQTASPDSTTAVAEVVLKQLREDQLSSLSVESSSSKRTLAISAHLFDQSKTSKDPKMREALAVGLDNIQNAQRGLAQAACITISLGLVAGGLMQVYTFAWSRDVTGDLGVFCNTTENGVFNSTASGPSATSSIRERCWGSTAPLVWMFLQWSTVTAGTLVGLFNSVKATDPLYFLCVYRHFHA
jgi:hypothetical protein